jgi:hypothetical protein
MSKTESEKLITDLKEWADRTGKSQADISRLLGIDRQRVSDWFAFKKTPTLEYGLRIQSLLKAKSKDKRDGFRSGHSKLN